MVPSARSSQSVVGLVALGSHHEEDRQRDPEAVLPHAEDPVQGDPRGEGAAEADRVAEAARAQGQVRSQRRQRGGGAPAALLALGGSVGDDPDQQRPGRLRQAARGPVEQRRPGVAGSQEETLPDHHRQRDREAGDRQAQGDREAVAGRGAEQAHRQDGGRRRLAAQHPEGSRNPDHRRRCRLPGRARARLGVEPGEAGQQGAGGDRALGRRVEAELDDQRGADRHRDQGAPAQRRPGRRRADREQRRGPQLPRQARGVEQARRWLVGRHGLRVT